MKNSFYLTTGQFAKLHNVNRRTLHYYDSIGLISPEYKGENNYRYYNSLQSMDFEYIRMLKELNMSIEEIKQYTENPNVQDFVSIIDTKTTEIENQVKELERIKDLLLKKKKQLLLVENVTDTDIRIVECEQKEILTVSFSFKDNDMSELFLRIKEEWGIEQCRAGVGSYISLDKIKRGCFDDYDGLFTVSLCSRKDAVVQPAGKYLCGYIRGDWNRLPELYAQMLHYADNHQLCLVGNAYETGMNDFVISDEKDYVTQILIKIQE